MNTRLISSAAAAAVLGAALAACTTAPNTPSAPATSSAGGASGSVPAKPERAAGPVQVKVLAINDFHGNLRPASGGIRIKDPADASKSVVVPAGGSEHLATVVQQLRAKNPNHIFVAAGDLIGATPLLSSLFRDEPTIESLNLMGLELSAVGNHEFDKGWQELMRMQQGGCHPQEGCKGPSPYAGANFKYLAASTVVQATGQTLLPAYHIKHFQGVPVAFIGLTLKDTPTIVVPEGVKGLIFRDEAETVNQLVPQLKAQGVQAMVLLIHEGGLPAGDYNECPGISGPIVDVVKRLDKAVDVVVSGHTHRAYNCRIDGRLVTSGDKYGTVVTEIDLTLDGATGRITQSAANNHIVRVASFAKDPRQSALIETYERLVMPLARRVVGRIGAAFGRDANPAGQSPLGQMIADAQLAATRDAGAQIALMNPGGIRAGLPMPADGQVRYEDIFAVQPFYNNLLTLTLSGTQLVALLEQQWAGQPTAAGRVLHVSKGFSYTWDASKPVGQRVVPGSLRLDGEPISPTAELRITVNNFLGGGGDNFSLFKQGLQPRTGMMDIDALEQFLRANPQLSPAPADRVTRLN